MTVEPMDQSLETPAWPAEAPPETRPGRSQSIPREPLRFGSRKTVQALFSSLAVVYAGAVAVLGPAFASRPGAILIHLLLLLAAAVVFLGLWDWLALVSLRHLLQRDRRALWRKYGRPYALRRRLDNSSFERDAKLAGGLVTAVLRRFVALGKPDGDFLSRDLSAAIQETRIGSATLTWTVTAAPLLGLLGFVLGLRGIFHGAISTAPRLSRLERLLPDLGTALTSIALGLAVALAAALFSRLLSGSVAEDCARLLTPVAEAARASVGQGRKGPVEISSIDERTFEKRELPWMRAPWSRELRRYRAVTALLSWIAAAVLILLLSLPGGYADRWLSEGPPPRAVAGTTSVQ